MKLYYFDENDEEYKEYRDEYAVCPMCSKFRKSCIGASYVTNCESFKKKEEEVEKPDNVEHPSHYKGTDSLECIDVIQFSFGIDGFVYYCAGNVLKYLWRYNNKNGTEDIKKAKQYLDIMGDLSNHMSSQAYDIYSRSLWLYKRSVEDGD